MSTEPLRLMQVMAGASVGGAEAFFERMAAALARAGVQQHLAIRQDPDRMARLHPIGTEMSVHRFGGPLDFLTPWQLSQEAKRFQPDVTLAWMSRGAAMAPKRCGSVVAGSAAITA